MGVNQISFGKNIAIRTSSEGLLGPIRSLKTVLLASLIFLLFAPLSWSQSSSFEDPKPVPVLSGGAGFITAFEGGEPHLEPLLAPVLLLPLGDRWLIESRAEFESDMVQLPGGNSFHGKIEKHVQYAQLDFIANPYLTVTAGRFLLPFGIFNERLYPVWVRNLQTDPLIFPIATGPSGAGTGGMLRGGFKATSHINFNYAAYFSTLDTNSPVDSDRLAGIRAGIFLPHRRLEIGGSFQHLLQDVRTNSFGFHGEWQPLAIPLDLRAEYARAANGSGYWIESAYRLSQIPFWQHGLRHAQVVARMQQFFADDLPNDSLPSAKTNFFEFGTNYYFIDGFRATASYGRQISDVDTKNIWTIGLTYRFAFPLGPGT